MRVPIYPDSIRFGYYPITLHRRSTLQQAMRKLVWFKHQQRQQLLVNMVLGHQCTGVRIPLEVLQTFLPTSPQMIDSYLSWMAQLRRLDGIMNYKLEFRCVCLSLLVAACRCLLLLAVACRCC